MARYNTFKYGAQKYGSSIAENLQWGLSIDWDDNDAFDGVNEASRLKHVSIQRGRQRIVAAGGNGFEQLDPGSLYITLDNSDRRYDPYNENSPLYPNVDTGRFIHLMVRVGAVIYDVFSGVIQNITLGRDVVLISAVDGHQWLTDQGLTSGAVYQNTKADDAINLILDQAKWPALWGRSLEEGADVLDYWWLKGRSALEEIRTLADSEFGRMFIAASGALKFYNRFASRAVVLSIDQSELLKDITIAHPWDFRKNFIQVQSSPIAQLTLTDIWQASTEYVVDAGSTVEITVQFDSPAANVLQPVATTDYTAFSLTGGAGDNLTANISITATIYAESASLQITNNGAQLAYLYLLKMRGNPLFSSVVNSQAIGAGYDRRPRTLNLNLEWQQDINNPVSFASSMLEFLSNARELPTVYIENHPEKQFMVDLFDPVTLQVPARNISDTFQVGFIQHEWLTENGQATRTTWKLEPFKEYTGWRFGDVFPVTFG